MNQNQKTSLTTNEELRKKYAKEACSILNKYLPENLKFSPEQIDEFAQDKTVVDNYVNMQKIYKEQEKKFKILNMPIDTVIKDENTGTRFRQFLIKNEESIEDQVDNEILRIKGQNTVTIAELSNDLAMEVLNENMDLFYPDDDVTSISIMKDNLKTTLTGFLFTNVDLIGAIEHDNPELASLMTNFQAIYQGNPNNQNYDYYQTALSILIPCPTDNVMEFANSLGQASTELTEMVKKLAEETIDFEDYTNRKEIDKAGYVTSFMSKSLSKYTFYDKSMFPENIICRDLVKKGIVDKNTIFKKRFTLNGNPITLKEATSHIDPVTLEFKDGLSLDPLPIGMVDKIKENAIVIKMKSNAVMDKETLARLNAKKYLGDFSELDSNLKKMKDIMDVFYKDLDNMKKADPDHAKEHEHEAYLALNENPEYKNLRNAINKDTRELNKSILSIKKILKENTLTSEQIKKDCKDLNYAALSAEAFGLRQRMTTGGDKENYYSDKQKELNEKFGQDKHVEDLNRTFKYKLNDTCFKDSLKTIAMINQKDEEYQHRGAIGKWWYKKSHQRMMNNKKEMIDFLGKQGVDTQDIDALGLDDTKANYGKIYASYVSSIDKEIDSFNNKLNEIYSKFIEEPKAYKESLQMNLPKLNKELNDNKKIMVDARQAFINFYLEKPMRENNIPFFDEKDYSTYKDHFKNWLNEPEQEALKQSYQEAKNNYKEAQTEMNGINITVNAIDKSFKEGIPFYPLDQDIKMENQINNDIKEDDEIIINHQEKEQTKVLENDIKK